MKPTGFVYQAAIICPSCAESLHFPYEDSDMDKIVKSTDDMNAVFSTDETDGQECCDHCFEPIETTVLHEEECPDCGKPNSTCICG